MNSEQRVWIASIVSAAVLVVSSQYLGRTARPPASQTTRTDQPVAETPLVSPPQLPQEELIALESRDFILVIGKRSATIRGVTLKKFKSLDKQKPLEVGKEAQLFSIGLLGQKTSRELVSSNKLSAVWKESGEHGLETELSVKLNESLPTFEVELKMANVSNEALRQPVQIVSSWMKADDVVGHYNMPEILFLTERSSSFQHTHLRYVTLNKPKLVPRRTLMATLSERFFCQSIRIDPNVTAYATVLPSPQGSVSTSIEASIDVEPRTTRSYTTHVYAGPRDFFILRDLGFEQAFPFGSMARIGLALMLLLKWVAGLLHSYGIAIIVFSVLVTLPLFPFTLLSFRSMKKMQELQPKIEQLKKKYNNDQTRVNKEMLGLFKEHRVSPISGCLPMLIQLPIFFSLLSAITHVIELRGKSFLWIKDLSLPDRLAKLQGFDFNILPIVMAGMMYLQSKMSQTQPLKPEQQIFSGPLMAIVFGVMFYQVPSSLVLYWMTNSFISIVCFKLIKV